MVELKKMNIKSFQLKIVGVSDLIMHKFSDKTAGDIEGAQTGRVKDPKKPRTPSQEYEDSIYYMPDGGYGFPSIAFKLAAIRAGKNMGITMTDARNAFHIEDDFVKIKGTPAMRRDRVVIGRGLTGLRYRAGFSKWSATLKVVYNESILTAEQITNMIFNAGFGVGVGDWRPDKGGQFGRFEIATG